MAADIKQLAHVRKFESHNKFLPAFTMFREFASIEETATSQQRGDAALLTSFEAGASDSGKRHPTGSDERSHYVHPGQQTEPAPQTQPIGTCHFVSSRSFRRRRRDSSNRKLFDWDARHCDFCVISRKLSEI